MISFFERLYSAGANYGTFTQQLKPVFDAVQRNLVRKGLLIQTEANTTATTKTKMELGRYYFPPEFALPPLLTNRRAADVPGTVQEDKVRAELRQLVQGAPPGKTTLINIELIDGGLFIEKASYSAQVVSEWRKKKWEREIIQAGFKRVSGIPVFELPSTYRGFLSEEDTGYQRPVPLKFIDYAFAQLAPDEWIAPDALATLLDVGYGSINHPPADVICQIGWDTNNLARHRIGGVDHFRPMRPTITDLPPERYLQAENGGVYVDVDAIPDAALEQISAIANLKIEAKRLKVVTSLAKMVDRFDTLRDLPVTAYLQEHSADFRTLTKRIAAQWGKLIVHQNLLVARITDLSLRVRLQKAFDAPDEGATPKFILLSGDYVAFPRALLNDIEKLVKKFGHVIKTVQAK